MTKAQQVRDIITAAKARAESEQDCLPAVMALGFQRQLARAYIKNNWTKVTAPQTQAVTRPTRALSMSPDAVRKREARAKTRAAAEAVVQ